MPDEIIEELWKIKDSIAREHGNDVRNLAAYLQGEKLRERHGIKYLMGHEGESGGKARHSQE